MPFASLSRGWTTPRPSPESFQGFRVEESVLGGSWVVISGVISPLIWVITIVILLITPLITTHEPPSRGFYKGFVRGLIRFA